MFDNDVIVNPFDKAKLMELMGEVNSILDRHPYFKEGTNSHTITAISRAKGFAKDAEKWISYLHTEEETK